MSWQPGTWLQPESAPADARLRLLLFHCAGGGASMYHAWPALFPSAVAVQSVQLPGRQDRLGEPAFVRLDELLETLTEIVAAEDDGRPFAFFGHSMGALLAYRLTVELERAGLPGPTVTAVAGWAPKGFRTPVEGAAGGPSDEVLVRELAKLRALPADLLDAAPQWLALALPAIRADIAVCAGYVDDEAVVTAPLVAYGGAADPLMEPDALGSWSTRTRGFLGARVLPGDHFFLAEAAEAAVIAADLAHLLLRHEA
ncbi:MAG: thioesterase [Streptomyces sp.]|uniref:thioesterase II family protein n=1 Tax=Streptomyces sp. TaxID=1931 RepID=UPI0025F69D92|nr:alpha/beta fold hydrolase [Streptomyces sp.]MBW8792490.1 thioesterase [Streptomyces sp.]